MLAYWFAHRCLHDVFEKQLLNFYFIVWVIVDLIDVYKVIGVRFSGEMGNGEMDPHRWP
jgi:hypothetical protein